MRRMGTVVGLTILGAGAVGLMGTACAADIAAGKAKFRQQCVLCHTAEPDDKGGAQGPALTEVFGRKAGSDPKFSYTRAMRQSGLTWDEATLDTYLAGPNKFVKGSTMVIPVNKEEDRQNVIAYLKSLKEKGATAANNTEVADKGTDDWKLDKPGRMHRIDIDKLPPPFATPGARNAPRLVSKPAGAQLSVPQGFSVAVFATGLEGPRRMIEAPNGDILVTEPRAGQVTILHVAADGSKAESHSVFAEGLSQPFGIEFYPNAENPEWVYVAETNRVVRYAYKPGDRKASGKPEIVVPSIPAGAGHFTRDIVFSPDGKKMYLSVGSGSNTAEEMDKKPLAEAQAWDKEKGATGATWGVEEGRADVLVYDVGSTAPGRIYATGLRNCVSLAIEPKTSDLWCAVNERDMLGDDLVPDYATRVKEGGYYGWPWYYFGSHEDPSLVGQRPDLKGKAIVPDVPFQAHSAALNLAFYTASSGKSAFPAEYVGDGFAVFHGSWNRGFRTGHKVVRIIMKDGVPTGEYQDFLTGFIVDDGNAWGRPVAVEELKDGSLLLSEDGNDTIYRISYSAQ